MPPPAPARRAKSCGPAVEPSSCAALPQIDTHSTGRGAARASSANCPGAKGRRAAGPRAGGDGALQKSDSSQKLPPIGPAASAGRGGAQAWSQQQQQQQPAASGGGGSRPPSAGRPPRPQAQGGQVAAPQRAGGKQQQHQQQPHATTTGGASKGGSSAGGRTAAVRPVEAEESQSGGQSGSGLNGCVNDNLQRVLDEEVVTYSWRRKDQKAAAPPASKRAAPPLPAKSPGGRDTPPSIGQDGGVIGTPGSQGEPGLQPEAAADDQKPNVNVSAAVAKGKQKPKVKFSEADLQRKGSSPKVSSSSVALVARAGNASAPSSSSTSTGATKSPGAPESAAALDLDAASQRRAERSAACAAPPDLGVKLVAYDHSAPALKSSSLGEASVACIHLWARGKVSGDLVCLFVDDWAQGEVTWPEVPAGDFQRGIGAIAGMLADAALERPYSLELRQKVFSKGPLDVAQLAAKAVLSKAQLEGDGTVLVSEVEHALCRLEAASYVEGSAKQLEVAVQRELLRLLWAGLAANEPQGGEGARRSSKSRAADEWLLSELARAPAAAQEAIRNASLATLRSENQALDTYLVRLLRLKRLLAARLDTWEKVDYYAILGVPPTVTEKELRSAYRKACLRLHPDKGGDRKQFQQLQDAYGHLLEEFAKRQEKSGAPQAAPSARAPQPSSGAASGARGGGAGAQPGQLALESGESVPVSATPAAAAEVVSMEQQLRERADALLEGCSAPAERAAAHVQQLKHKQEGGLEALRAAQEAGEELLRLSNEAGELGPALSEATMEVAECSLGLAARLASVPASLLLTDVALSCTFEASRIQHAAKQLLEVRRDTVSTLQTLQMNLNMAKIVGTVDKETLKLSLGLVGKASSRIMSSLREVVNAVKDALQRGRQCSSHAKSVAAFAEGRSAADKAAAEDDAAYAALPAPEGAVPAAAPPPQQQQQTRKEGEPHVKGPPSPGAAGPGGATADSESRARAASLESRLQNDRLLRQLNGDLLQLQQRAKSHVAKRGGSAGLSEVSTAARTLSMNLVAEVLLAATEAVVSEFTPEASALEALLAQHFGFVEACSSELAMPMDLPTQLVRLAALLDVQAVLGALQKQAKARVTACCQDLAEAARSSLTQVIDRCFESLYSAIVASRIA